jgi:hypothetical protein
MGGGDREQQAAGRAIQDHRGSRNLSEADRQEEETKRQVFHEMVRRNGEMDRSR